VSLGHARKRQEREKQARAAAEAWLAEVRGKDKPTP